MSDAAQYTLELCARIASITDVPGTTTRLFLSPATRLVHALLTSEMESLGMTVRTDSIGNLRGIYPAANHGAPTLLMGSHLDTVPDAVAYDGILGVALPLAVLRKLEGQRLPYAIEVIAFSEEEGIRFKLPFLGSRALVGTLKSEDLVRKDAQAVTVAQAVRDFGLDPETLHDAAPTPGTFAFVELHIEQGPLLEHGKIPLGVVETISGQTRLQATFTGQANHAGTTPMGLRKDALACAAHWIFSVESLPRNDPWQALVATVGMIEVFPGAANIIPGSAILSLDVRHPDDRVRARAVRRLMRKAQSIASYRGVEVSFVQKSSQDAVIMDLALRSGLLAAAESTGHAVRVMPSGAGHDAMIVAAVLPSAMLFLRTPRGLSHHPEEAVLEEDVAAAVEVCLYFLRHLEPGSFQRQEQATADSLRE